MFEDGAVSLPAVWGLAVGDAHWGERLDASTDGVLRSFWAVAALIPLTLVATAGTKAAALAAQAAQDHPGVDAARIAAAVAAAQPGLTTADLWSSVAYVLLLAVAFPLLALALVRWLGGGPGYGALIVTMNWASFWVNLVIAVAAVAVRLGLPLSAFSIAFVALNALLLYVTWRAARETLTGEISLSLLMTLLYLLTVFAAGYLADPIGSALG